MPLEAGAIEGADEHALAGAQDSASGRGRGKRVYFRLVVMVRRKKSAAATWSRPSGDTIARSHRLLLERAT